MDICGPEPGPNGKPLVLSLSRVVTVQPGLYQLPATYMRNSDLYGYKTRNDM
jgi:hypothetical protein